MAILGGAFLRLFQTVVRVIQTLASILVLGIYSYFLAVLSHHDQPIAQRYKAVEGMSGAAVLYGLFAVLLTIFLGGFTFFGFLAVLLDICFIGCYIAIAWFNRDGTQSCGGFVNTPLGSGNASGGKSSDLYDSDGFGPDLTKACRLEKAVLAVAIVNCFLFAFTAAFQVLLVRHHKKEKRYGPGPSNNYTSGSGRGRFWRRNKRTKNTRDAEMATAGGFRPSHDTGYTGTTAGGYEPPKQTGYATNY
ncbi:MAG: hypothetical protein Q9227_005837 [Pyrenula ochraceoflavens]